MSSNQWKTCLIGDIGRIITGKTPSTKNSKNFGNKYPFITPRDMFGQKKVWQTERYLSEVGKNEVKNCLLPTNSVCVSCIGSDMGKVALTTQESVTNQQLNSIICEANFDPDFVYYGMVNISSRMKNSAHHSTAVPILNKTDFSNFEFCSPDIDTQKRVAFILSALDNKIELNRQTNETLEAIAQAIYKEWFVNFNFSGATGEMQDSELGPIPSGWQVGKLEEFFDFLEGPGLRNWQYKSEGIRFINIRLINDNDIDLAKANFISDEEVKNKYSHFLLKPRDMVVSTSGTLGRTAIVRESHLPLMLNTSVIRFRPIDGASYPFMYQFLQSDFFYKELTAHAAGSVQLNFGPSHLKRIMMLIPPMQIIAKYTQNVSDLYSKIGSILDENQTLTLIREDLLPKLMNGDIEV